MENRVIQRGLQRRRPKLSTDSVLFDVVRHYLQEGWSPEQIAGTLKRVFADDSSKTVSHETIYNAIYVMPRGELRTELSSSTSFAHKCDPSDGNTRGFG